MNKNIDKFGFIITRHVNNERTNKYWNTSVKMLNILYPLKKIIIIDDNSKKEFVKANEEYKNITIIESEYPGRGELLPYIYFYQNKWFENAIIIHDSVFFHKKINFNSFKLPVLPLWSFAGFDDNPPNTRRIAKYLSNNRKVSEYLGGVNNNSNILMMNNPYKWVGVFGCQSYINWNFLSKIYVKYNIKNLINAVNCRTDRCSLERIFGIIFCIEYPILLSINSVFGHIQKYLNWGYSYEEYEQDIIKRKLPKPIIKVWTGR